MAEKKNKAYEAPRARSLTATTASGQSPLGDCLSGGYPYVACSTGGHLATGSGCTFGDVPDIGQECFPFGTTAENTCGGGLYA